MNVEEIKNQLKNKLSDYLNKPGSIIYSSVQTIRKGDYYILGLNPGGISDSQTIGSSIKNLGSKYENSYIDEKWDWRGKELDKGKHPFQNALNEIAKSLNIELKDIFASNLIFIRTRNAKGIEHYANTCWQVYQYLIKEIIKPKVIFAIGNSEAFSAYSFLKKINSESINNEENKSLPLTPIVSCKSFTTTEYKVIGLPHLSRFSWIINGKNGEAFFNWLKKEINPE